MRDRLTVEEVAKRLEITPRTLHYYEEMGLIQPSARTEGGHRLYDGMAIAQLESIRRLKDHLGYSLQEIRSILDAEASLDRLKSSYFGDESNEDKARILEESVGLLQGIVNSIEEKLEKLSAMRDQYAARLERARRLRAEHSSGDRFTNEQR